MSDTAGLVDAAQRAAGIIAARHRGDGDGAASLVESFRDDATLAGGSLLLASMLAGLYADARGLDVSVCLSELVVDLEGAVHRG